MRTEIHPKIENAPEHLTYKAVSRIIGKHTRTISRLLNEGRLEKIGKGRAARITLSSVLRYLEQEKQIAKDAATVSGMTGHPIWKARQFLIKKQQEEKLKRALERVNAETGIPKTESNPTGDPR